MASPSFEPILSAYDALNDDDCQPLAALFTPETVWRGIERRFLWWRKAPT
jgi:hypothetical protein